MKKTVNMLLATIVFIGLLSVLFYACKKDENAAAGSVPENKQNISLFMTDDPGFFDNVYVDIQSVSVWVDTCSKNNDDNDEHHDNGNNDNDDHCKVWEQLNVKAGIYDLLTLRNGTDTLLGSADVVNGKIKLIKIDLGTNNSLVKDGVSYPLSLKINTDADIIIRLKGGEWDEFSPRRFRLWLDFDVSRSVIRVSDNKFYLQPFLKCFTVKTTGSISGKLDPVRFAFPVITAYNSTDTAYALPNPGGEFKIRGLVPGSYTVSVNASNGYADTTFSNVIVTNGREAKLGKINLHK